MATGDTGGKVAKAYLIIRQKQTMTESDKQKEDWKRCRQNDETKGTTPETTLALHGNTMDE